MVELNHKSCRQQEGDQMSITRKSINRILFLVVALMTMIAIYAGTLQADAAAEDILADNGLPVVYVDIGDEELQKVNESLDHSYRCTEGTITVTVPEGYKGDYSDVEIDDSDTQDMAIEFFRGRGNSTWSNDKKPYTFKLKSKTDLLGMGSDKTWVLLANRSDPTLLKNRISMYLGRKLGVDYTPKMLPVDVVMNDQYYGSYLLAQDVRISESRVAIDKMEMDDISGENVTGGYILSLEPYAQELPENVFTTEREVPFGMKEPEFTLKDGEEQAPKEQRDYIIEYMQKTEDAIYGDGFKDADGIPYTDYMDADSAAKYWWIQFFTKNSDGFSTPSTYLYKSRGGKLGWGPLWDFDLTMSDPEEFDEEQLDQEGFNILHVKWLDHLRANDPAYRAKLLSHWAEMDSILEEMLADGGDFDRMAAEIRNSYMDEFELWGLEDPYGEYKDLESGEEVFDAACKDLKDWLTARREWINKNISDEKLSEGQVVFTYKLEDGTVWKECEYPSGYSLYPYPAAPGTQDAVFKCWKDADSGELIDVYAAADRDRTLIPVYVSESEARKAESVFFRTRDAWADLSSRYYQPSWSAAPSGIDSGSITWTSSDTSIAEPAGDVLGRIKLKKQGKVTITAEVLSGASFSYDLTIYDAMENHTNTQQTITPEQSAYTLEVGDIADCRWKLGPQPCSMDFDVTSSDEGICSVGNAYELIAVKPGKAVITARSGDDESLTAKVNVTVVGHIDGAKIVLSKSAFTYNGKVQKPTIKTIKGLKLKEGTDYTVKWSNGSSRRAGTYTLTVTGKGVYTGTAKATYTIKKAANPLKVKGRTVTIKRKALKKKARTLKVSKVIKFTKKGRGTMSYRLVSAKKGGKSYRKYFKVNAKTGKVTVKKKLKKGTYTVKVKVKAAGATNYKPSAWKTVKIKVKIK